MTTIEIEMWAQRVANAVAKKQPFEDTRVELKAEFIEPTRAARRIAAHANSAFGEPILWLIGADETRGLLGVSPSDLADWFAQVRAEFTGGVYPALRDVVTTHGDVTLCALQFETDRAPYVVKSRNAAGIECEVPWREGTLTRTARREELLMLLQPDRARPTFEVIEADIKKAAGSSLKASVQAYIVPREQAQVVFPFHRCSAKLTSNGRIIADGLQISWRTAPRGYRIQELMERAQARREGRAIVNVKNGHEPVELDDFQLLINRPACIYMECDIESIHADINHLRGCTLELTLGLADYRTPSARFSVTLEKPVTNDAGIVVGWELGEQ